MHIFGSKCYAYVHRANKLDVRSKNGIFEGYDDCTHVYPVFYTDSDAIEKLTCVKFIDKNIAKHIY